MSNLQHYEVQRKRLRGEAAGVRKQFEKYVGLWKNLWALRNYDSGIIENERDGGDEKSVFYISEVRE